MLRTQVRVSTNKDAARAVDQGTQKALLDAAGAGYDAMYEHIAAEATDTSQLLQSGVPPEPQDDGSVVTGFAAEYAPFVNDGTAPHWAPIEPLLGWARRTLGSESAAYAVQRKIAQEGTEGIHFMEKGIDAIRATIKSQGISDYISEELR